MPIPSVMTAVVIMSSKSPSRLPSVTATVIQLEPGAISVEIEGIYIHNNELNYDIAETCHSTASNH